MRALTPSLLNRAFPRGTLFTRTLLWGTLPRSALLVCALVVTAGSLRAQGTTTDADTSIGWRPLARFASVGIGVPQQLSASVIIGMQREWGAGTRRTTQVWYLRLEPGLAATKAAVGIGLWRFADQGGGATLQVAALRTYGTPWEVQPHQTYLGAEIRSFVWLTGPWIGYYERQGSAGTGPKNFFSFGISLGF